MFVLIALSVLSCKQKMNEVSEEVVQFSLSGAITSNSVKIRTKFLKDYHGTQVRAFVHENRETERLYTNWQTIDTTVMHFEFAQLSAKTPYRYGFEFTDNRFVDSVGMFSTFPEENTASDFTIAFSCGNKFYEGETAQMVANDTIFDVIKNTRPLLFIHTGDFHYADLHVNDYNLYKAAYESRLTGRQAELYKQVPLFYIWDDHDYGDNNSSKYNEGKPAVHKLYRDYFPHYDLAGNDTTPIYQAFTIGRVRFIATDLRTESDPGASSNPNIGKRNIPGIIVENGEYRLPDIPEKTMLGEKQKAWFKQELLHAKDKYALIVWISTRPWIGSGEPDDRWWGYSYERRELARFIHDNEITNLCMIAGDMHGVAIDDGRHNGYYMDTTTAGYFETTEANGFPVFHAASLTSGGSVKGGPYSHGVNAGSQQFGIMKITDNGESVLVQWEARNPQGIVEVDNNKIAYRFEIK